ncbi:hypothetical protein QEN19_004317 [Hanseniaspora menglaensis]
MSSNIELLKDQQNSPFCDDPFRFFNSVVNEEISRKYSTINAHDEENADDYNYALKSALTDMLDKILSTDLNNLSRFRNGTNNPNNLPSINSFQIFIKELFEIVHSPDSLNFAIKFIIDSILTNGNEKYLNSTVMNFIKKLICSGNHNDYPDDYSDDSLYISKFCEKYILVSKVQSKLLCACKFELGLDTLLVISKAPYLNVFSGISNEASVSSFIDSSDAWANIFNLVNSLKLDKNVLSTGRFSSVVQNTIFNEIRFYMNEANISDIDFLKYLFDKITFSLSRNELHMKTPNGEWKFLITFLKQHQYFKSLQPYFTKLLSEYMVTGFNSALDLLSKITEEVEYNKSSKQHGFNNRKNRGSKSKIQYLQQIYETILLENESSALMALTFVNEGLVDVNDLLEEFSKINSLNQDLQNKLESEYNEMTKDNLLQQDLNAESSMSALASASVLTTENDTLNEAFAKNDSSKMNSEKSFSPPIKNELSEHKLKENKISQVNSSLEIYPQILLVSQMFERGLFNEALKYVSYFKYSLFVVDLLANKLCLCLNMYWNCIKENTTLKEKTERENSDLININTQYNFLSTKVVKKWEYWGNLPSPCFDKSVFIEHMTQFLCLDISGTTMVQLLETLKNVFYMDLENEHYDENYWISFVIRYLCPQIIKNDSKSNDLVYEIVKKFSINKRFEIYRQLEIYVIRQDSNLKRLNSAQLKQIKRFLKIINVDTISEQSVELAILANINPLTVFDECLKQAESYDMISTLVVESVSGFSQFALDVLQYSCLKRFKLDRPYMARDEVNVLPWLAKLTTFILSVYNLNEFFNIEFIMNNVVEKVVKMDYQGLYILKEFLSKTTNSVYLDEPQYHLAILLEASQESSQFAKSNLLGMSNKKSARLLKLLTSTKENITIAQSLLEALISWILNIFYDSLQLTSSINSKYDSVNCTLKLMIDFIKSNISKNEFISIFNLDNFENNVVVAPLISNSWRKILFSTDDKFQEQSCLLLDKCPKDIIPLVKDFWVYSLKDVVFGALKFAPYNKFDLASTEKSYTKISKLLKNHQIETHENESLKYFLEECIFKNIIMGVSEAIYTSEFLILTLNLENLTHLMTMMFTRDYLKRVLISISSNETLFLSVFFNRLLTLLNNYESLLDAESADKFKADYFNWMKCFVFEVCELILDSEYLNSRAAIQLISESVDNLLGIDILVDVLSETIDKKLKIENREELIVPLTSLNGFTKNKLKTCKSVAAYLGYLPVDEDIDIMSRTWELNAKLKEINSLIKDKDEQILELEAQKDNFIKQINAKRTKLKEEAEEKEKIDAIAKEEELKKKRKLEEIENEVVKRRKFDYGTEDKNVGSRFEGSNEPATKPAGVVVLPKGRFGGTEDKSALLSSTRMSLPAGPKSKSQEAAVKNFSKSEELMKINKPPIVAFNNNFDTAILIIKNILEEDRFTGIWISKLFFELEQEKLIEYYINILFSTDIDFIEFFQALIQKFFAFNFPENNYTQQVQNIISQLLPTLQNRPSRINFIKMFKQYKTPSHFLYDPYSKSSFLEQFEHYKKTFYKRPNASKQNDYQRNNQNTRIDSNQSRNGTSKEFGGRSVGSRYQGSDRGRYRNSQRNNQDFGY